MSFWSRTKRLFSPRQQRPTVIVRHVAAKYDAAQTNDDNRRHWANADSLSASAALSPDVRRKLRDRCRYEVANNSYAKGIGLTLANDTVGVGPTLQLLGIPTEVRKFVETEFYRWTLAVNLPEKLRQLRFARYDSGEAFVVFGTNEGLPSRVKLGVSVFEADQIANPIYADSPAGFSWDSDGIRYDDYGNPTFYRKLRTHPGSSAWFSLPTDYDDIDARSVFHYYRAGRPGQLRGIPELTPAIESFMDLRRFLNATIAAAETAANHAAVITTTGSADPDGTAAQEGESPAAWDKVELEKRGALVMPEGYAISQLEAEHPNTVYKDFVYAKLNEIARCLCVPFHIAAMDASIANMSSSYVVGQMYAHERIVDRGELDSLMNMAFDLWLAEASRIAGYVPEVPAQVARQWFWPSLNHHADPLKVANAAQIKLASGQTSLAHEYAREGLDWEEQIELAARSLGVTVPEYQELLRNKLFGAPAPEQPPEDTNEPQESTRPANGHAVAGRW